MRSCEAVLFDLDDTLFLQSEWLDGAWQAVAQRGASFGLDPAELQRQLLIQSGAGSARGGLIDRALAALGASVALVPDLVEAFTGYRATSLTPFAGVAEALESLRRRVPVGIVTDGNPQVQRSKISSLGLVNAFDVVVVSDDYGREHRKPHSLPFTLAASLLGVERSRVFMVGDHPDKDVAGAAAVGMAPIRVRTGEYSTRANPVQPWADVANVIAAIELIDQIDQVEPTREVVPGSRPAGPRAHLHRLG